MHEFKHPNYYKELRKRNKTGQAISDSDVIKDSSDRLERAPGQGLKPQAASFKPKATSFKL